MPPYFADTWFFIALHDRFDAHYLRARAIQTRLSRSVLVTHEAVFTEMLAHFADDGPWSRARAAGIVRDLIRTIDVITPDRPLFLRALDRYEQRLDKEYSLVDCMSMVVMEERGIHHVLTNDHHFTQAGFTIVNQ
jgi:uncharacterized protein